MKGESIKVLTDKNRMIIISKNDKMIEYVGTLF